MASDVFFDFFGTLADDDPSVHPAGNAPLAFARRAGCAISAAESDARWQQSWDQGHVRKQPEFAACRGGKGVR